MPRPLPDRLQPAGRSPARSAKGATGWLARASLVLASLLLLQFADSAKAYALTVTPATWNMVGLDSNTPSFGPYRFPVGAKFCGGVAGSIVEAAFSWDAGGTTSTDAVMLLRPGSGKGVGLEHLVDITFAADGCADAYFEVEVARFAASFDHTRRYHITAGGVSTPTPRELYVEHLISQNRNSINAIQLNGVTIPPGGSMDLVIGGTYDITLVGQTAPAGYNQFMQFINLPNTIFQIESVTTNYLANDGPYVLTSGHKYLYADACRWENDPNSPNYRSCWEDWKSGSIVDTTYRVKVLSGAAGRDVINSLLFDFSGSSYHYNADYFTGARFVNVIDPTTAGIAKNFTPATTTVGGDSTLTFTLSNPNVGSLTGLNFTDTFPPNMIVATPAVFSTSGCGTPVFAPVAGATSISFTNGTLAANSNCTVQVNVTAPIAGSYNNVSGNLFVNAIDTLKSASATLVADPAFAPTPPPPATCATPVELARWDMGTGGLAANPPLPLSQAADVATASASFFSNSGGVSSISTVQGSPVDSWAATAPSGTKGWLETATSANNYFEFIIDTSHYGGVFVTFDVGLFANGDWASPNSNIFVNTQADAGAFATTAPIAQAGKGTMTPGLTSAAVATGLNTTTFRFSSDGGSKAAALLHLDNVVFSGCRRPNPPTLSKVFTPATVAVDAYSTLSFTVTNPNPAAALSGIAFTDTMPAGLAVASGTSLQCGGTLTTTYPSTIAFSGGTLAAATPCNITAPVQAITAGPHNNVSGFVESAESGINSTATGIASATLTAVLPPVISKLFAQTPILVDGYSQLTFSIINPNQNDALTGVAFSDTFPVLPAAMTVFATPGASTTGCGTPTFLPLAGAASIAFANGTIAGGGTCQVTVNVTAPAVGDYLNSSGNVSHFINAAVVNGNTASDTLTVTLPHPTVSLLKQVSDNIAGPWTSYLITQPGANLYYRFTIENPGDVDLTGVRVSDPAFGGTVAGCTQPDPFSKYAVASCTAGPVAAITGTHTNTATVTASYGANIDAYSAISSATYATSHLSMVKSSLQRSFSAAGEVLNYNFVVTNDAYATLSGPIIIYDDKSVDESCPAISTVGDFDNYLETGESLICSATYTVLASDVIATQVTNDAYATAVASKVSSLHDTVTVILTPTIAKTFTPATIDVYGSSTVTLTITNPSATALTGMSFSDPLVNMQITGDQYAAGSCGGVANNFFVDGYTAVAFSGLSMAGNSSCTVSFNVSSAIPGIHPNTTSGVLAAETSAAGGVSNTASLTVIQAPTIAKAFTPATIDLYGASTVTLTITNPSATALTGMSFSDPLVNMQVTGDQYAAGSCGGVANNFFVDGYTAVAFSGLSMAGNSSCTVSFTVGSTIPGTHPNTTSGVLAVETGIAGKVSNTANLTVLAKPTVSKSFLPATIGSGATSVLSFTLSNPNGVDVTIANPGLIDVFPLAPGAMTLADATVVSNSCGSVVNAADNTPLLAGAAGIRLNGGTIPAGASCSVAVNVTASVAGSYLNTSGVLNTVNAGASQSGASSTLVVSASGVNVSGQLYQDLEPDQLKGAAEDWAGGVALYVNLVQAGAVVQSQLVNAGTGLFSFAAVTAGNYTLVVSDTAINSTAVVPAGWLAMMPATASRAVSVAGSDMINQDFGFYSGSTLSGRVFVDDGSGGGTANDGLHNGSEAGIANVAVRATDATGITVYQSVITAGDGSYKIYIPGGVDASVVKITETNPGTYISTGAKPGNSAGLYDRVSDSMSFTFNRSVIYAALDFGDVPENGLLTDGQQTALPGTTVYFPHTFHAATAGSVAFATTAIPSPGVTGWNELIYLDANCNIKLDAGESQITAAVNVQAGDAICLLIKQFTPLNAAYNTSNTVTLSANFSYSNASPVFNGSYNRTDLTIIGQDGLVLTKSVDMATAKSGDTITYTITYTNPGSAEISNLVINDATPAYTTFVIASCGVLPANLNGCTITDPGVGNTGTIHWVMTGTLAPLSSASVQYSVLVDP